MQEHSIALIVMLAAGLVTAACGIPLARGRIRRNRWYGFRLPITLSDDRIWYPLNRTMGWFLIWIGLLASALVVGVLLDVPYASLPLVLVVMGISGPCAIAYGAYKASKLKDELEKQDRLGHPAPVEPGEGVR